MNKEDLKIVFLGREFGQILKEKLEGAGFRIVDPESPALPAGRQKVDLIVVGFYGKILSKKILETPTYGALNVHPSLLPKYRGPAPVQAAILNGETETGVTIIRMDEQIDHGPIIAVANFNIGDKRFTTPELTKELWELGGDLLVKTIPLWIAGEIKLKEQNHKDATYTKTFTKEGGHIDWGKPAEQLERQIRAFTPWPGSFTFWQNKRIEIIKGYPLSLSAPGVPCGQTFLCKENQLGVQSGEGIFVIEILKPEGKDAMSIKAYLNGHQEIIGAILS